MKPKTQSLNFVNGYAMPRDGSNGVDVRLAGARSPARRRASTPRRTRARRLSRQTVSSCDSTSISSSAWRTVKRKPRGIASASCTTFSRRVHQNHRTARENSGLTQGAFLRRHVVEGVTLRDLNVNTIVTVYGFTFHIYRCDEFTREYLERAAWMCPKTAQRRRTTRRRGAAMRLASRELRLVKRMHEASF